jgi:hypothetical protein
MTGSSFAYRYDVGTLYGRVYQIGVRADPSLNDIESFAAVLFYETADGDRTEIARIDDTSHEHGEGDIHLDKLYREHGADRKDHGIDVAGPFEADHYLSERWETFAQQYETTHNK